nr:HEAT repeat domain-containing protein [Paracidovorax avenae]
MPELMAALEQARTPRDAEELAEVLAQLEGPAEQQWPRAGLHPASLQVRRAAALQLARTASQQAAQHLRAILPELSSGDAVSVAEALALMIRVLQADVAPEALLEALGRLGDPTAVPAPVDQLSSPNARRRKGAAVALAQIANPAAGAPLVKLLLEEMHLEVAQASMQAWPAMGAEDDGALAALAVPGTRAFPLTYARQLRQ